jgi:Icc protein
MRVVHISDLHLRHNLPGTSTILSRLSRDMPALFTRALQQIEDLEPDLFVLSGDLLDYPLDRMKDTALSQQAVADMELIQNQLERIRCPQILVYGNHDHPALFHQVFDPIIVDEVVGGMHVFAFLDEEGSCHIPVRTGNDQRRFEDALSSAISMQQIHVQHYLVWPLRNEEYPHTYGAGLAMRDDIVAAGSVRLVLSGHYHQGVEPAEFGGTWFATVPAFCEAPHPFWVYDLDDGKLIWRQHEVRI